MPFYYDPDESTYNNILRLIDEVGFTTQQLAAEKCEVTTSRSQQLLNKMVARGQIERIGNNYVKLGYDGEIPDTRKSSPAGREYRIKDAILEACDPDRHGFFSSKKFHGYTMGFYKFDESELQRVLTALVTADILDRHGDHLYTLKGQPLPPSSEKYK